MNRAQKVSLWDAIIEYVRARQGERDVRVTAGYMDAIDRLVDEFIAEGRASRRDMFAAAALPALIIADAIAHTMPAMVGPMSAIDAANEAARQADAMIAALDGNRAIDETGAEVEELAALNKQLSKNADDADVENEALADSLRDMVAAVAAMLDPNENMANAVARLRTTQLVAREVLTKHGRLEPKPEARS